jgi:transcriptional regulator with XRE-family HTH domain
MPKPARRRTARRKENLTPSQVVADQIKDRREAQGMSQQQLAERIGETQSTIARMESGRRTISVDELFKVAVALDVAPVHLLAASFRGDSVPLLPGKLRLKPMEARAWIRGHAPIAGVPLEFDAVQRFMLVNIPGDEAEALIAAAGRWQSQETQETIEAEITKLRDRGYTDEAEDEER